MKHNDISNQRGFVIGIRCEDCLLKLKDEKIADKLLNTFFNKIKRAEVNEKVLSMMNYIYWETEMTVALIIDKDNYSPSVGEYLSNFPCNTIDTVITNISEITMRLNTGELTYFVTDSTIEKSEVNSRYAMTVDEFNNTLLKRRGRVD